MQSITNRFDFNKQLKPFVKDGLPVMAKIHDQAQISMLMRENPAETETFVYLLFKELNDSFKIKPELKLNDNEVTDLASDVLEDYFHYRPQDFALFVKNAKNSFYGKSYNRLDIPMIREWLKKYDAQRSEQSAKRNLNMRISDEFERESPKQRLNLEKMKESFKTSQIAAQNEENDKLKQIDKF